MLTEDGGRALQLEFKQEQLELPPLDLAGFAADMSTKMNAMVKEKREKVTKTREDSVQKHGACGKKWTETQTVEYEAEETKGFKVPQDKLKACWQAKIGELIGVSQVSTQVLIEQQIIGEVEKYEIQVKKRCDDYIRTIQVHVQQKRSQQSVHVDNRQQLQAGLTRLGGMMDGILHVKASISSIDENCGFHMIEELPSQPKNYLSPA